MGQYWNPSKCPEIDTLDDWVEENVLLAVNDAVETGNIRINPFKQGEWGDVLDEKIRIEFETWEVGYKVVEQVTGEQSESDYFLKSVDLETALLYIMNVFEHDAQQLDKYSEMVQKCADRVKAECEALKECAKQNAK